MSRDPSDRTQADHEAKHRQFLPMHALPSWFVSMVVHALGLLILALLDVKEPLPPNLPEVFAGNTVEEMVEELPEFEVDLQPIEVTEARTEPGALEPSVEPPQYDPPTLGPADVDTSAAVQLTDFSERRAPKDDLLKTLRNTGGTGGYSGRGSAERNANARALGGTEASEKAVALALEWLAEHQLPDGSWCFDQRQCPRCGGRCSHPGSLGTNARNGATALAVLPFLGSGQTHKEGKYKETVFRGLQFLTYQMKPNGDLRDGGNMYSHGLCAIALCEAYGMTHDKSLMMPAQAAVNFIAYAQDPVGGGWRYGPKQAGDTSAVGWQLMALKSAHMSYLNVPPATIAGAIRFLDSVQQDSGAKYGYTSPGAGPATTAVGLLCRMYLGWKKDHPGIEGGARHLSALGPHGNNMYFNYYATQVLRHYEGELWEKWNVVMRDRLVERQAKAGHEKGSWHLEGGDHGVHAGGRLYTTAMATMILEVYYRHMPIYGKQAAEEDFPL